MIQLDDVSFAYPLSKRYRDYIFRPFSPPSSSKAVEHVSLRIEPGERVAIVGQNGAGKTTLLKLIAGLLYPNSGSLSVFGLPSATHSRLLRRRVGYVVSEERSFFWRLTGRQNLEFFAALNDLHGARMRVVSARLLAQVGIAESADKRVSDYSSGMRQRLALARGLLLDPEVLLLDEPTRSLDPIGADKMRELILMTTEGRDRILITTTNQFDDMIVLCNRICVIHDRRIVADQSAPTERHNIETLVHRLLAGTKHDARTGEATRVH